MDIAEGIRVPLRERVRFLERDGEEEEGNGVGGAVGYGRGYVGYMGEDKCGWITDGEGTIEHMGEVGVRGRGE